MHLAAGNAGRADIFLHASGMTGSSSSPSPARGLPSGRVTPETNGALATPNTVKEYIWLPETQIAPTMGSRTVVDRPLAVVNAVNTATPVMWWVSVDHLHRPIKMTDAAKTAVWTAVWQPWGSPQSLTGTATLDARFPGQWYRARGCGWASEAQSKTAGLHYNWHRSYDPSLGRYTQPDPLGFVDGPSVFGYAGGKPTALVDFPGLMPGGTREPPSYSRSCPTPPDYGDCDPDQHKALQDHVNDLCNPRNTRSCFKGEKPGLLISKIQGKARCIEARKEIAETCYKGREASRAAQDHLQQITNHYNGIDHCNQLLNSPLTSGF